MIISEFRRLTPGQPRPQQLPLNLLRLLRGIFVHHPQLTCLKMLIITDVRMKKAMLRRKLLRILTVMGSDLYSLMAITGQFYPPSILSSDVLNDLLDVNHYHVKITINRYDDEKKIRKNKIPGRHSETALIR